MKSSIRTAAMVAFGLALAVFALLPMFVPHQTLPALLYGDGSVSMAALLAAGQLTLADWSKRLAPDGTIDPIVEMLSQQNDILEDAVFMEGNLPTGHRYTQRTGLPAVYFRAINQGIPDSKSTTTQVDESCAMMEAHGNVDAKLLALNGNSAAFRLSEDSAFIEAMNQKMAATIFSGNPAVDQKQFLGMASRYSSTSAGNGKNVLLAGGSGSDNASAYLIGWGEQTVFMPFPKGSRAGLQTKDLGEELVSDGANGKYLAARSLYQWDAGMAVKDWRYVVRIANIDVSDWVGVTGTQAWTSATHVLKMMVRALARIPNRNMARLAFYVNRTVGEGLMVQALDRSSNAALAITPAVTQFGQSIQQLSFLGVPIRIVDQLGDAESLVS